jgi:hypothetical protein
VPNMLTIDSLLNFNFSLWKGAENERTVQLRAGIPGHSNASLVTEGFKKDRHVRIIIKYPESDSPLSWATPLGVVMRP